MQTHYDAKDFAALLEKFANGIAASVIVEQPFNVVGIRTRGELLAQRLLPMLAARGAKQVGHGTLDITLYRDDLSELGPRAIVHPTELDIEIDKRPLVLVDDVLYTGRTARAALDALADFGRPSIVRLAVFVDRGGRELPIHPDAAALRINLPAVQQVKVKMLERDGEDGIDVMQRI
ncbi:MAG: bifunctional pyrimidine regulatory protein PyrR uracil phosphoribosyltransferase [Phycisphaerales bacterium]|nr:bifunctional pyrimidine regulatory protein PyrR uracil phosphoribosyltransferase [Phycisphaerales bacterium]